MSEPNATAVETTVIEETQLPPVEETAAAPQAPSEETSAATTAETPDVRAFLLKEFDEMDKPAEAAAEPEDDTKQAPEEDAEPEEVSKAPDEEKVIDKAESDEAKTEEDSSTDEPGADDAEGDDGEPVKILTREEIDEQYKRSPKEIRELTAKYGEMAQQGQEVISAIGGEHFLEPVKLIASGLKSGENLDVFAGYMQATGIEGLTNFLGDALELTFVETQKEAPKNEGEKFIQEECRRLTENVLKSAFGENATIDRIKKLCRFDADGYLNTEDVERFYEENTSDKPAEKTPREIQLEAELDTLRQQQTETETAQTEKQTNAERQLTEEFEKSLNSGLDKTLQNLVFKKSVLAPVKGESEIIATGKAAVRSIIQEKLLSAVKTQEATKNLRKTFLTGETNTSVYKNSFASLLDSAVVDAKQQAAQLEPVFALLNKLSRNTSFASELERDNGSDDTPTDNPTQTKQSETETAKPEDNREFETVSNEEWRKQLVRELVDL